VGNGHRCFGGRLDAADFDSGGHLTDGIVTVHPHSTGSREVDKPRVLGEPVTSSTGYYHSGKLASMLCFRWSRIKFRSTPMNNTPQYAVGWFTLSLINAGLAQGKNRSGLNWFLLSLLLGHIATFILVALCEKLPAKN
jgi:hypothetical protein